MKKKKTNIWTWVFILGAVVFIACLLAWRANAEPHQVVVDWGEYETYAQSTTRAEPSVFDIIIDCEKAMQYSTGIYFRINGTIRTSVNVDEFC